MKKLMQKGQTAALVILAFVFLIACKGKTTKLEDYTYAVLGDGNGQSSLSFFNTEHKKIGSTRLDWKVTSSQYATLRDSWLFYSYPGTGETSRLFTVKHDTGMVDKSLEVDKVVSFSADDSAIYTLEDDGKSRQYNLVKYSHDFKEMDRQEIWPVDGIPSLLIASDKIYILKENSVLFMESYDKETLEEIDSKPLNVMGNLVDGRMIQAGNKIYGLYSEYNRRTKRSTHNLLSYDMTSGRSKRYEIIAKKVGNLSMFDDKLYFIRDSGLVEIPVSDPSKVKEVAYFNHEISAIVPGADGLYLLGDGDKSPLIFWSGGQPRPLATDGDKSYNYSLLLWKP